MKDKSEVRHMSLIRTCFGNHGTHHSVAYMLGTTLTNA